MPKGVPRGFIPPDRELLARFYVEQKHGATWIAERLGRSAGSISYWLNKYEIPVRPPGKPRKLPSRAELVRLYVEQNLGTPQIAKMFGTVPRTVRVQLLRAGIRLRRHTVPLTCQFKDCREPVQKIRHDKLKTEYGTLCKEHRTQYRRLLAREYSRANAKTPKRFESKLVENRAVFAALKQARMSLKLARTSLRALSLAP